MMRLKSVLIAGISLYLFGLAQAQQPTNEAGVALVQQLSSYYPNLFCEDLFTKSQFKGDGFQFLRTEIPWYWDLLKRNPDQLLSANQQDVLGRFHGFCAGDAHPENFAIQAGTNGQPIFGINDQDDAGVDCPVMADFLRFLVAIKLSKQPVDTQNLLHTYIKTLQAKPDSPDDAFQPDDFLANGLKTPATSSQSPADTEEDPSCDPKKIEPIREALARVLPHSIDDLEITKCHDKKKGSGGSGGLPRYNVTYKLISAKTQGKIRFTGTQRSGVSFLTGNNLPPTQRYPQACSSETGKRGSACPVIPISGEVDAQVPPQPVYFLARTKDENDRSVELKHLGAQLPNVLRNEVIALARLHREHLAQGRAKDYAAALASLGMTRPEDGLDRLADRIAHKAQEQAILLKGVSQQDFLRHCQNWKKESLGTGSK